MNINKKIISSCLVFVLSTPLYAQESSIKEMFRPFITSIVGAEKAVMLIGEDPSANLSEYQMPQIPVVDRSSTSTKVYDRPKDQIKIDPSVEAKFNYAYINEVFDVTRKQKPNEDEIAKMMNILSQGGTRTGIYRSLVLDSTYGGMENWDVAVKSKTADYALDFYKKFLGRDIKKKSFEGMNIYTLKRLMTENALEVLDAFEKREDAESWYGLFSQKMAKEFPSQWKNDVRKNTSAIAHKDWASKVPLEHMKSEVIIKLHTALNTMN